MTGIGTSALWILSTFIAVDPALFEPPVNLSELNTSCRDKGPFLSCDGLTLYFHSDRSTCDGTVADVWFAARPSLGAPFGEAQLLLVNGADPSVTCDELTLFFIREVNGPFGRNLDLFTASRPSRSASFGVATPIVDINSPYDELGPRLTHDGLSMYFATNRPGSIGQSDIWISQRATPQSPFQPSVSVTELNTSSAETNAAPTHDNLTLYFGSDRAGGTGGADIYRATRASTANPWGSVTNLTSLNSALIDKSPAVSGDGLAIVFRSTRGGGSGSSDLYQARDARSGTVGSGFEVVTDVLFVNGSIGGPTRTINIPVRSPLNISLNSSPFGPPAPHYALIASRVPLPGSVFDLPGDVGALPFPLPAAGNNQTITVFNNFEDGWRTLLREGRFPANPAPGTLMNRPQGLAAPRLFTIQAVLDDSGSRSPAAKSTSNAITVIIN